MKHFFICLLCLQLLYTGAQAITLLYRGPNGWNDPNSWIQMDAAPGQQPVSRVPAETDDVVLSRSLSGYTDFAFGEDVTVGGTGSICRSIHVSNMTLYFSQYVNADYAGTVDVYTTNGGFILADSGSDIHHGIFRLHGGNANVTDLQVINSKYGDLFTHAVWSSVELTGGAKARFINSTLEGWYFKNDEPGGQLYADSCTFVTLGITMGGNTKDTLLNSIIKVGNNFVGMTFFIGKGAQFTSDNLDISAFNDLKVVTSGSVLRGNIRLEQPGYFVFGQEDEMNPLPNIIDGNVLIGETYYIGIKGDFKISGNLILNTVKEAIYPDTATIWVDGQPALLAGGLGYISNTHSKIEFFGAANSNVLWPAGFPIDTLIINKSQCAKVTFTNPLYVRGAAKIIQGQLALDPNDTIPYKFVCGGDVDIAEGGGVFLRKNAQGVPAHMAVQGNLIDHNTTADSSCTGISNPYAGHISLYRNLQAGSTHIISVAHTASMGNLYLLGTAGTGFTLGNHLEVNDLILTSGINLLLGDYNLTVTGNITTVTGQ